VEFGVLGPLQVNGGNAPLAGKQRVVLATLLLRANRVVPVDALIDAMWDDAPPPSARTTLQGYVKQLRQNAGLQIGGRVVTRPPGYLITVADGELDLDRFTGLCDRARPLADRGDWRGASGLFGEALALWRGEPLAGVPSAVLDRSEVPRLAELRMRTVESRVEMDLRLGRHAGLVAELRRVVSAEPLREGLHGQLMLALYRCGRQAEALQVFRAIDRRLRGELGIAPGPELSRLHQRILTADPSLDGRGTPVVGQVPADAVALTAGQAAVAPPVVPAQLPADTVDFTGRDQQVAMLCGLLTAPPDRARPGAVVISAVAGMGGIGKTALAVHTAHRLRDRFSDGQLYVSLRGATNPLPPSEVIARFLRDLGDRDAAIPAGEEERAARYRSLLAGRKVLVVLDDARDAAQVRPLLPGSAGCAVIVTSRNMLPDLPGATPLGLGVLGPDEALALFSAIIGTPRAAAEPDATARVLACCAGLPLAIRVAGSRLASRPAWTVAQLAARLADKRDRLAELAVGDLAVRASFAVSYAALTSGGAGARDADGAGPPSVDPAWLFRLLGLPDMAELPLPAVAALAGQPAAHVAVTLETLTDACLLESPSPDRFRLHDLLRSYAADLAARTDHAEDRDAAIGRLLHWYAEQAVTAAQVLAADGSVRVLIPIPALGRVITSDPEQAYDWFECEQANLVAAVGQGAGLGLHDIAAQISVAMFNFYQLAPYAENWLAVSQVGVASARELGDDAVLSFLLTKLAAAHVALGRSAEAVACRSEALAASRRAGDKAGEAVVLTRIATDLCAQERFEEGLEYFRSVLTIHTALGMDRHVGITLNNIGYALLLMKRAEEALGCLRQALAMQERIGDRHAQGATFGSLGDVYLSLGRFEEAVDHYRSARAARHGTQREHADQAAVLYGLATALARLGRADEERDALLAALPILDRIDDPLAADARRRLADPGSAHPG
jgi:DNA-binding SARP family transcriptional activator/tetratricopeptide (TPR) repeat protein